MTSSSKDLDPSVPTVLLNGIWFSADGSVPKTVIDNLQATSDLISKNEHPDKYKNYFWTDVEKLNSYAVTQLKSIPNLEIRDYRKAFPDLSDQDKNSKMLAQLFNDILSLGSQTNKLAYAMASDLLRIYLLFKTLPKETPNAVALYRDLNDIQFQTLPNPKELDTTLKGAAFSTAAYRFESGLMDDEQLKQLVNNDVIVVNLKNHNDDYLTFFNLFCENLQHKSSEIGGFVESYKSILADYHGILPPKLAEAAVIGFTHITGTLAFIPILDGDSRSICSVEHSTKNNEHQSVVRPIAWAQDVDSIKLFKYVRDEDKGKTWRPKAKKTVIKEEKLSDADDARTKFEKTLKDMINLPNAHIADFDRKPHKDALLDAVECGRISVVKELLRLDADPNITIIDLPGGGIKYHSTALNFAITTKQFEIANLLIEYKQTDLNIGDLRNEGRPALALALTPDSKSDNLALDKIALKLYEKGAFPRMGTDHVEETRLFDTLKMAIENNRATFIFALETRFKKDFNPKLYNQLLPIAVEANNSEIVQWFRDKVASKEKSDTHTSSTLQIIESTGMKISKPTEDNKPPITLADPAGAAKVTSSPQVPINSPIDEPIDSERKGVGPHA